MSDGRSIAEKYMSARTTGKLKLTNGIGPAEMVAAAGMAGQQHGLAFDLWVLHHHPSARALSRMVEILALRMDDYAAGKRVTVRSRRVVRQTLAHWLSPTCRSCGGHGKERISGTPHLSDVDCGHCHGTGERQLNTEHNEMAQWLLNEIRSISSQAEPALASRAR